MVLTAIVAAGIIALRTKVPFPVPDFALQSESLYRVAVGGGSFFVFYLAVLAFVLAMNGRGFTSIGPRGVKADQVVKVQQGTLKGQEQSIEVLERNLERNRTATAVVNQQNREQQEQINELQEQNRKLEERLRRLETPQG